MDYIFYLPILNIYVLILKLLAFLCFRDPVKFMRFWWFGSVLFIILSNALVYDITLICLNLSSIGYVLSRCFEYSVYLVRSAYFLLLPSCFSLYLLILKLFLYPIDASCYYQMFTSCKSDLSYIYYDSVCNDI